MTFWAASGFLWQHLASFIKNKIKQSKNKAICYHILVFTVLKEQRVASSQKIHQGRCFTFIKGQRDNCLFSKMNLPVLYVPWSAQPVSDFISESSILKKRVFMCLWFLPRTWWGGGPDNREIDFRNFKVTKRATNWFKRLLNHYTKVVQTWQR